MFRVALAIVARDTLAIRRVELSGVGSVFDYPRWSPDGRLIAYQRSESTEFDKRLEIMSAAGNSAREIARADDMRGLAWLPDGSAIIYPH